VTSEYRPRGAWLPVPQTPRYAARPSRLLGPLILATMALLVASALVAHPLSAHAASIRPLVAAAVVTGGWGVVLLARWRAAAAEARRLNAEVALRPGRHARDAAPAAAAEARQLHAEAAPGPGRHARDAAPAAARRPDRPT